MNSIKLIYDTLLNYFGPQYWWPGDSTLEICLGAILTQNTNWKNVEIAIKELKQKKLLNLRKLNRISENELARLIKSAGYFNAKSKTIKNFIDEITQFEDGSLDTYFSQPTEILREKLLNLTGIGPETADSIILYAAEKPVFVVDAYTRRLVERHFGFSERAKYSEIQDFFMANLEDDPRLFNEFHALIVKLGKEFCKKHPRCFDCPLLHL
ncbi:MAG: endonuclease III domain-containing protein [bacterium]|nr:endonuclease III domain-containing protein [bacterium]